MRIGILTFHRAHNFGAFLQAFALKTFLVERGHEVEFVDYWPKAHAVGYKIFQVNEVHSISSFLREVLMALLRVRKQCTFKHHQTKYLGIASTPDYTKRDSLANLDYDVLIYGSDQIWWKSRLQGEEGFDPTYWGEYVPTGIRKVAYAASMGIIALSATDEDDIKGYLEHFESIAVREKQLAEALCRLTTKEVHVTIDPTLLLTKQQWSPFLKPINEPPYILYYEVMSNKQAEELAEHMARTKVCKLIKLRGHINTYKRLNRHTLSASPFDFISLIYNAECVVSTSFHGVAFSIIFEKQFIALGMGENSGRVASLLDTLGISGRMIRDKSDINSIEAIDYQDVGQKLAQVRELSVKYLLSAIK